MSSPQVLYVRVLARASELCGGPRQLPHRLGITELNLDSMLGGSAAVPEDVFLQAVSILSAHEVSQLGNAGKGADAHEA